MEHANQHAGFIGLGTYKVSQKVLDWERLVNISQPRIQYLLGNKNRQIEGMILLQTFTNFFTTRDITKINGTPIL